MPKKRGGRRGKASTTQEQSSEASKDVTIPPTPTHPPPTTPQRDENSGNESKPKYPQQSSGPKPQYSGQASSGSGAWGQPKQVAEGSRARAPEGSGPESKHQQQSGASIGGGAWEQPNQRGAGSRARAPEGSGSEFKHQQQRSGEFATPPPSSEGGAWNPQGRRGPEMGVAKPKYHQQSGGGGAWKQPYQQGGRGRGRGQCANAPPPAPGREGGTWNVSRQSHPHGGRQNVGGVGGGAAKYSQNVGRTDGTSSIQLQRGEKGLIESMDKLTLDEIKENLPFKLGTLGRPIKIETNHVLLNLGSLETAYRYDVKIQPEKKPKRILYKVMQLFQQAYYPNNHPAYDGQNILFSAKQLPIPNDMISGKVSLENQDYEVTLKITGTVDLSPLHNLLQKEYIGREEAFRMVEIVLKQAYVNSFVNVGRRFYTPPERQNQFPLGLGAEMYLGGFQASVHGWMPLMNVDVAHKAFTQQIAITDLMAEMFGSSQRYGNREYGNREYEQLNTYLKKLKIIFMIPNHPGSKRLYTVNRLALPANQESFEHERRRITVEEYFRVKYNCQLKNPEQPTLWVGPTTKKICLPMELCTLKDAQPLDGSRLLGIQTSKMIEHSAKSTDERKSATATDERKKKIQNVMAKAKHNSNECVKEFGIFLGQNFEAVDARVLDAPKVKYANRVVDVAKGTWSAKQFYKGANLSKWTIVAYGVNENYFREEVNQLARMILAFGNSCGMKTENPVEPFKFFRSQVPTLTNFLEKHKSFDLIFVIISDKDTQGYPNVKQVAEQRVGCLTQCIRSSTLKKLNAKTVTNILLKVNKKLNGINHILASPSLLTQKPCLVMGADVTHPSPHGGMIPSVYAVTASCDLTATRYNIFVGLQKPRETMSEIIQSMETITLQSLRKFVAATKKEPERLLFLRDGVSDGEFDRVREVEVQAIRRACATYKQNYKPTITFLVVKKRHHVRFFPTDPTSKADNVPVGTCVDTVITDPTFLNYFLLSHQSIKGVGRPTKYAVLVDDANFTGDQLEELVFYLCHLYARCTRSVSYPAPTYFAHLVADRAKAYLYGKRVDFDNLKQDLVKILDNLIEKNPMFWI